MGVDRNVPKIDFGAGCMTVYIHQNISNFTFKMSEIIYVNYISLKPLIREGNGTPLQYFCLENPMDGGVW